MLIVMSLVRARLGEPKTRCNLIGVDDAEVPPVSIPNTELKLCGAEDSAPETGCENMEMPVLAASFSFIRLIYVYDHSFRHKRLVFFLGVLFIPV